VARVETSSFRSLLYRYWFYGWLFRDVNHGSQYERAAAWRHNQAAGRWLPVYLRRWSVLALATYLAGWMVESTLPAAPVEALFFVPCVASVTVNAVTLAAWLGLKLMPAPWA
jgi:hypothetical protein